MNQIVTAPIKKSTKLSMCCISILILFQLTACSNDSEKYTKTIHVIENGESRLATGNTDEHYFREEEYPEMVTLPLQYISTTSGNKLGVVVTLPANDSGMPVDGQFPAVFVHSAYNNTLLGKLMGWMGLSGFAVLGIPDPFLVKRGYVQVSVDAMGTGLSEGGWRLLGEEEQSGMADAIDWISQQPWSNGKIGAAGISYMAISALFVAQSRPDSIQAVFASLPMGDAYRGTVGTGGLVNGLFMSRWMSITHALSVINGPQGEFSDVIAGATREHTEHLSNHHLPLIEDALNGVSKYIYDNDYWRTRSPIELMDKVKAPTLIMGALDDLFQRDEPLLYEHLINNNVDSRLVIYDGHHIGNFVMQHKDYGQVPPSEYLLVQWFDKHLKGLDTGIESLPPVMQEVKNYPTEDTPEEFSNDSFTASLKWPHPAITPERWYLHGDTSLSTIPPLYDEPIHQMNNPEHPTAEGSKFGPFLLFNLTINDGSTCSRNYIQWSLGLAYPNTCYSNSADTTQTRLRFDTPIMEEDYYINGPIQADIWIDSNVTDAIVSVYIEEVSEEKVLPITNGLLLASARSVNEERSRFIDGVMMQPYHYFTEEKREMLIPGEVTKLQIEIFPTSAIIRKGNKLRISISASNQAQGIPSYPLQTLIEGGITTIHNSPEYPSNIVLPALPVSTLN